MTAQAGARTSITGETAARPTVDITAWYRQYGESVYRRCLRLCGDASNAHDLTQEVFLRAHRFQKSYRGDASPSGWLYAIANRCFFDSLRGKARAQRIDRGELRAFLRAEDEGYEAAFTRHALVGQLLARANDDVREIVLCRYFDEMEIDEIAAHTRLGERTVRRKLERFIQSSRKFLK